ncbi:hypothetical protein [Paenibacillus sp. N3.4]|uniref:RCC1 domain-containing protein n=1 Tax=Paenibacillus sp. N3.4 TaxID=2603222 RepID=UPI0011C809EF|nr:hypothetical protein [Paenibacillus sp. N3.4]TXK76925.1 hypothetical protein FU659_24415 [Paenibacillus sp. N3.4]
MKRPVRHMVKTSIRATLLLTALFLSTGEGPTFAAEQDSPKQLSPSIQITSGARHNIAYNSEGKVWYWGDLVDQVDGEYVYWDSRPLLIKNLDNIASVTAGINRDLLLKKDGTVWEWGRTYKYTSTNGKNAVSEFRTPTEIKGLPRITKAMTYASIGAAIDEEGGVWVWTSDPDPNPMKPVKVDNIKNAKDITAGTYSAIIILKDDGTVWESTAGSYARQIEGLSQIEKLSSSSGQTTHNYAIQSDGTVWGWGSGLPGSKNGLYGPVIVDDLKDAVSINTGIGTTVFVKKDGSAWLVGRTIGDYFGTRTDVPIRLEGLDNIKSIALTDDYVMALTQDDKLWKWKADDTNSLVTFKKGER